MMICEHLIHGRTGRWDAKSPWPRTVACGGNDGSAVYVMPETLMTILSRQDPDRLHSIAEDWRAKIADGKVWTSTPPARVVAGVAALAREAVQSDHRVYCWASQYTESMRMVIDRAAAVYQMAEEGAVMRTFSEVTARGAVIA
jgi:hypothetical protein